MTSNHYMKYWGIRWKRKNPMRLLENSPVNIRTMYPKEWCDNLEIPVCFDVVFRADNLLGGAYDELYLPEYNFIMSKETWSSLFKVAGPGWETEALHEYDKEVTIE